MKFPKSPRRGYKARVIGLEIFPHYCFYSNPRCDPPKFKFGLPHTYDCLLHRHTQMAPPTPPFVLRHGRTRIEFTDCAAWPRITCTSARHQWGADTAEEPSTTAQQPSMRACVLVDMENRPSACAQLLKNAVGDLWVYGVATVAWCSAKKQQKKLAALNADSRFTFISATSKQKDAADTALTLYLGKLMAANAYERFVVLTGDHFGVALGEIDPDVRHALSVSDALAHIS